MNKNKRAFTLLEVLVAMTILALVLTAVLRLQLKSTQMTRTSMEGFELLVAAVKGMETTLEKKNTSEESREEDGFQIKLTTQAMPQLPSIIRQEISVTKDGVSSQELSIYKFQ